MRLLLDELYSKEIAEQLRKLGHDVVAVTERVELVALMPGERRAIVTENWAHFAPLIPHIDHCGVLFTSAKQLPRGRNTIGLFVRVLDEFLRANPAEDALLNSSHWLP